MNAILNKETLKDIKDDLARLAEIMDALGYQEDAEFVRARVAYLNVLIESLG